MRPTRILLLLLIIFLAACGGEEPTATPAPTEQPTNPPATAEPTQPPPTDTPPPEPVEGEPVEGEPADTPAPELVEGEPAEGEPVEGNTGTAKNLPAPTLIDTPWGDRSPFQAGLIDSQAGVLNELLGATVYHMDLVLDEPMTGISGRQEVLYTNQEDAPLDAVYYHLFPNLLGGSVEVSAVTVNQQPVSAELQKQDTILRVPLESPLPPGGQVVIQLEFLVNVPTEGGSNYGVFATTDGVAALAHFYPQIAVYDAEGWHTEIPPANADVTYGDSAFYLVRLTAPASTVFMTSGIITDTENQGDNQVLTIASGPTRDFYLAGSDRYIFSTATVGQTTVKSYGFPEFSERVDQARDYAVAAIESYSRRFGIYPFTEFELGPTPNLALGVEYPGVVVLNGRIYDPDQTFGNTPSGFYLEGTTAHEVGHQWWYSLVGNDQLNAPWIDESLTQYSTYLYFIDQYGQSGAEGFRQSFVGRWDAVDDADIPIGMPAGEYEGAEYSAIIYGRGPLFFEALSDTIGEDTFNEFIMDYFNTYEWGIATGPEMKALAEQHCACDLTPLFEEWVGGF